MTVEEWLKMAKNQLKGVDAELLLMKELSLRDRTEIVLKLEEELGTKHIEDLRELIERRRRGEPLAYLLGYKEFYGRKFLVDGRVLIPRSETEGIVEFVKDWASGERGNFERNKDRGVKNARREKGRGDWEKRRILDVGTGSGCIAVSIKKELPELEVTAVDISESALEVARENARRLGAEIEFWMGDFLIDKNTKDFITVDNIGIYDIIMANLPYVDEQWEWIGKELAFEPRVALFAENGGLEKIEKMVKKAGKFLKEQGWLVLEADPCQETEIKRLAESYKFGFFKVTDYVFALQK